MCFVLCYVNYVTLTVLLDWGLNLNPMKKTGSTFKLIVLRLPDTHPLPPSYFKRVCPKFHGHYIVNN